MDQITVSDIPLPGEEFSFKTDSQATDDASNADLKPEPIAAEQPLQEVQEVLPCTIEVPELDNQPAELTSETVESSGEIQTIVTEVDTQTTTDTEVKPEAVVTEPENETETIASELLQDVTEAEVECVTSDVISETIEELQMEVERVVSEETEQPNKTQTEELKEEEQVVEQPTEVETTESTNPEEDKQQITEDSAPVVEEPPTPAIEEDIIKENNKKEEVSSPKPAKKTTRTNSTIEAIKNDWADSLTIEEIDEETEDKMNEASAPKVAPEPQQEPIVTEPDNKPEEGTTEAKLETVDNKHSETITEIVDSKSETKTEITDSKSETITEITDSKSETITETVTNNSAETTESVTEVLVLETVNEEIVASVDENVTIEIIDNTQQQTDNKTDEQQQAEVKEEDKETTVYIVEEVANNNTTTETTTTPAEENVKIEKPKRNPSRVSQRLSGPGKDDKLQIPCHVLGRNVDNPTEDLISNGRTPPKPRLGVKVPYRFLTSQIVSKEEIADELIEITNKRNPAPDPPAGGDIFFASKLTQRLASKIALNANKQKKDETTSGIPTEALNTSAAASATSDTASGSHTNKNSIGDNSDLLAILEGDDDVDWTKELRSTKQASGKTSEEVPTETKVMNVVTSGSTADASSKDVIAPTGRKLNPEMERQLALKQLREMPFKKEARGRPRKHHHLYDSKSYQKQYLEDLAKKKDVVIKAPATAQPPIKKEPGVVVSPVQSPAKPVVIQQTTNENIKQAVTKLVKKIKENEVQEDKNKSIEVENDLNLNPKRVTKTYSRKEAVLDVPAELEYIVNELEPPSSALPSTDEQQQQQQPAATSNNTPPQTRQENKQKKQTAETTATPKQTPSPVKKTKRSAADINKPEVTLVSKRARIIKRKVIWDPAEVPKTRVLNAIRKAQALELKARKKQQKTEDDDDGDDEDEEDEEDEKEKEKPTMEQRQLRKNKILPRSALSKVQKKKFYMKRQLRSLKGKLIRSSNGELKSTITLRQKKKQQVVMVANKPKKTELDRLLGDEGAVNMLYSVRQKGKKPSSQKITQKELLNRKKVIRDVITQSSNQEDTPKALRKKESPSLPAIQIPPRKKSRDSVRSSLQSPPPSPSYFHPKGAEASRIIRRHSSSFSSECSSPRRLSVDQQPQQQQQQQPEENGSVRVLRRNKTIVIQQPQQQEEKQVKTPKKSDTPTTKTDKDSKLSVAEKRKLNVEMSKNFDKTPKKRTRSSKGEDEEVKEDVTKTKTIKKSEKDEEERFTNVQTEYKEILLKKSNNFYQIVMNSPANAKLKNVISLQMFRELGSVLTKLSKDESCKVLALTSTGKSFCRGLDFSNLIQTTADKRSAAAQEMSKTLKEFILTLAKFPKPLIASLHASTSLLGCTMLPYFDVVICSETATLSADYSRLGHCPEGAPGLALCPRLARDMMMLGKRFTAKAAMDLGLVTQVEKPEKLEEAVLKMGNELCEKSLQCLTATKCLLRQPLLSKLEEALELEGKLLVEHWVNPECQQNFKKLLQEEELW